MSRLRELIDELCPDGVVQMKLGSFAECFSGATPKKSHPEYWNGGTIPWMSSGEVHQHVVRQVEGRITQAGYDSCSTRLIPAGTVVVALAGQGKTRGTVAITDIELCTNQSIGAILCSDIVDNKYLYYYLSGKYDYLRRVSSGEGTRGGLNMPLLRDIDIPVPPIEVQREIVRILDSFQELNDALTAEIEMREKQLDWFRARIYSSTKYPRRPLSSVGTFERGRRFTRAEMGGEATPCIHYGDIYTKCDYWADEPLDRLVVEKPNLRYARKGDVIVAATSENAEDVCKAIVWLGDEDAAVHDDCQILHHDQNPIYLSFFFNSEPFMESKMRFVTESKVVRISGSEMGQIELPVPPVDAQNHIAESLMTFVEQIDAIKDEREARQRQFEFYRDRLLSFPEKEAR